MAIRLGTFAFTAPPHWPSTRNEDDIKRWMPRRPHPSPAKADFDFSSVILVHGAAVAENSHSTTSQRLASRLSSSLGCIWHLPRTRGTLVAGKRGKPREYSPPGKRRATSCDFNACAASTVSRLNITAFPPSPHFHSFDAALCASYQRSCPLDPKDTPR